MKLTLIRVFRGGFSGLAWLNDVCGFAGGGSYFSKICFGSMEKIDLLKSVKDYKEENYIFSGDIANPATNLTAVSKCNSGT